MMAPILVAAWQYRRVLIYGAFVLIIAAFLWRVSVWHNAYERIGAVEDALEAEVQCAPSSQCQARQAQLQEAAEAKSREVVSGYEAEIAALRNRRPVVRRLCPDNRGVPDAGDAPGPGGTGAGGIVHGQAGEDPAVAALYDLARDADEVRLRLKYLQEWNAALSAD